MKVLIIKLNYQYIIQVYTIHQSYYQTVLFKHIVRLMRCFHRNFFTHFLRFWCCNNLAMRKVICKKKIHNPPCLRPNLDLSRLSQLQWINGKFLSLVGTTHQSISINYNLFSPLHFKAYHSWLPFEKKFIFGMQKVNCCIIYVTFLRYLQWKMDVWVFDCIKTINLLKCHRFAETLSSVKFQEPVNFSFRDISSQWQGHSPRHRNS